MKKKCCFSTLLMLLEQKQRQTGGGVTDGYRCYRWTQALWLLSSISRICVPLN